MREGTIYGWIAGERLRVACKNKSNSSTSSTHSLSLKLSNKVRKTEVKQVIKVPNKAKTDARYC